MDQPLSDGLDTTVYSTELHSSFDPPSRLAPLEPFAVDAAQAAALIGVSRSMFFKLVDAGRIGPTGVRLGRCVRYPLPELRAWVAAGMPPRHEWVKQSS